jgi:hypothetical protein
MNSEPSPLVANPVHTLLAEDERNRAKPVKIIPEHSCSEKAISSFVPFLGIALAAVTAHAAFAEPQFIGISGDLAPSAALTFDEPEEPPPCPPPPPPPEE